jgi:hypothetical protein
MGEQDGEVTGGFLIRDKRRFDSAGIERRETEERGGVATEAKSTDAPSSAEGESVRQSTVTPEQQQTASERAKATAEREAAERAPRHTGEEMAPGLDFASFVISLATQAFWQLGLETPPPGIAVQKDIAAAKQTIDIISVLKTKTRGNLSADEERLMEEVLHGLRMAFVRAIPS